MSTVELPTDKSVKPQSLVRLHPDGVVRTVESDLKGKWGYRSTQINNYFMNQSITSDNDGNSYWFLDNTPGSPNNSIFIGDQVYTVPNDNSALIFSFDINGKVRWVAPISSTNELVIIDIKYDGHDLIVFVLQGNENSTVNFGSLSATTGDNSLFIAAITVEGIPVVLESLQQIGAFSFQIALALDVLDNVTTAYVTGLFSVVSVRLTAPTQVFPVQFIPFTLRSSGFGSTTDGQGYLYISEATDPQISNVITLLDGRTVTIPAYSTIVRIYPLQSQSPGIVVGPNGAPTAVWVIAAGTSFMANGNIIYAEECLYLSFSLFGSAGQVSINGMALGTSGSVNTGVGTEVQTAYIIAMPRGISSFVDGQVGPLPLAVYSTEYPVINTSIPPVFGVPVINIAADNHGNIYALVNFGATVPIRAGKHTVNSPCILRLDKDLSVISAREICGSLLVTVPGNTSGITANTRGDIWFSFLTTSGHPIVYDNLYLPSPSNTRGTVIIHATVDRAAELLGYTECVEGRTAKTQWPAVAIPKSIGYPGQEVGVTDDGRFAVSSATSKVMDPALTTHGLSTGKEVLLTSLGNE